MGVYDRDYSKSERDRERGADWRFSLPPRGTLALIVLHVLGFLMVVLMRPDAGRQAAAMFVLQGAASHPAAIVLYPIGGGSALTLPFVVCAIWVLGRRLETRIGAGRLLLLYFVGTIIAGGVYFGFAQVAPDLASYALAMPAGALAAWVLAARRNLCDEMVSVFGRLVTAARATTIGAAIVAVWIFFWNGPEATGWLIAAAAGSLAWPAVSVIAGNVGAATEPPQLRQAKPVRPRPHREEVPPAADEPAVDEILDKISREGLDALTPAERDRLEAARQAKLRQPR